MHRAARHSTDPESKGGSEATVRIAKRGLVPTVVNLRPAFEDFTGLVEACNAFMTEVNGRVHRETRWIPSEMLAEKRQRQRLHPVPERVFTATFGQSRRVGKDATIQVEAVRYSVPHTLIEENVWVRFHGQDLIVTAMVDRQPVEVARRTRSTPGNPSIDDAHYPAGSRGERVPKPTSPAEAEFLAIGPARRCGCRRQERPGSGTSGPRWPTRSPWQNCTEPQKSTALWVLQRPSSGSPTAT